MYYIINMSYLVEIDNPSIKWAMDSLGIKPEEMIKKNLEDFAEKNLAKEIQFIRFEFHKRQINKTLEIIKEMIKNKQSKAEEFNNTQNMNEEPKVKKKSYINIKDKKLIMHAIESSKFEINNLTPINKKKSKSNKKINLFEQRQRETFKKLTLEQKINQSNALTLFNSDSIIKKPHHQNFENLKTHTALSHHSLFDEVIHSDIDDKLLNIEEKLEKSRKIHNDFLDKKREIAKITEKPKKKRNNSKDDIQIQTLHNIIKKQNELTIRKERKSQQDREKLDTYKKNKLWKLRKIEAYNQEKLKQLEVKAEAVEQKSMHSKSFYNIQKQNLLKGVELKAEILKLKDEQASITAQRIRKIK